MNGRGTVTVLMGLLLGMVGRPAFADFVGPTAPANWTVTITGHLGTRSDPGSALFTSTQLTLTGGNSGEGCPGGTFGVLGPCQIQTTISLSGTYAFNWTYSTTDEPQQIFSV
jgi:hypothetical protein